MTRSRFGIGARIAVTALAVAGIALAILALGVEKADTMDNSLPYGLMLQQYQKL